MKPLDTLVTIRAAIGASCWLTPVTASKLFGINIADDVSGVLYLRLGGTRDLALAAGSRDPVSRPTMLKVAAACDVGDIIAVVLARRAGKISKVGSVLFVGASAACLALGAQAMSE